MLRGILMEEKSELIGLTDRQNAIMNFIVEYVKKILMPPSYREIGEMFGITSTNGVAENIKLIAKKGWIVHLSGLSRGILLSKKARDYYGLWFCDGCKEK